MNTNIHCVNLLVQCDLSFYKVFVNHFVKTVSIERMNSVVVDDPCSVLDYLLSISFVSDFFSYRFETINCDEIQKVINERR